MESPPYLLIRLSESSVLPHREARGDVTDELQRVGAAAEDDRHEEEVERLGAGVPVRAERADVGLQHWRMWGDSTTPPRGQAGLRCQRICCAGVMTSTLSGPTRSKL